MMIRWSGAPKRPANLGRGREKLPCRNSNPSSPTTKNYENEQELSSFLAKEARGV